MAATVFPKESFAALIKHHVGMCERFKHKPFSVVFIYTKDISHEFISKAASKTTRQSDAIATGRDLFLMLMPDTDREGASAVVQELLLFLGGDFEHEIAVYKEEGESYEALIASIKDRATFWHHLDVTL